MKKVDRIGRFKRFKRLRYQPTNRPTNQPTNRPMDMTSTRSARTHLKRMQVVFMNGLCIVYTWEDWKRIETSQSRVETPQAELSLLYQISFYEPSSR